MNAIRTPAPPHRQRPFSRKRVFLWTALLSVCAAGLFAAYHYGAAAPNVEVPVAKARIGDLTQTFATRGELKAAVSFTLSAPSAQGLRIVKLAASGKPVRKGDIVVAFSGGDGRAGVRAEAAEPAGLIALPAINDGGEKLGADLPQRASWQGTKDGPSGGRDCSGDCPPEIVLRAPADGIVKILPNSRVSASFGSPPPFREGDVAWSGAAIAEIPDLRAMRLDLTFDEVERGQVRVGQAIRFRVDAIPDMDFHAILESIGAEAELTFRELGPPAKMFSARAAIESADPRLRPGMTGPATVITSVVRRQVLIPVNGSFLSSGQPAVYVQKGNDFQLHAIEVGERNGSDLIVTKGLSAGDVVALENPVEAARRANNP